MNNILSTIIYSQQPTTLQDAEAMVDYAIATASYALRATINRTLGVSPGALVFHRDMLMDLPFVANLLLLRNKRQALIDYNLRRENNARRNYDYKVGDYVLKRLDKTKMGPVNSGPFRIERIHTNGTFTLRFSDHVTDRVNIRGYRPFFR